MTNPTPDLDRAIREAVEAERKSMAAYVKFVGETFLLDMTAKPDWQDDGTWGRMETLRHVLAAIRKDHP